MTKKQIEWLENDIFNSVENHCCESCNGRECVDSQALSADDAVKEIMQTLRDKGVIHEDKD